MFNVNVAYVFESHEILSISNDLVGTQDLAPLRKTKINSAWVKRVKSNSDFRGVIYV
jgi:hypothetical protein